MNITTMQMEPDEARRRYIEYRKSVRQHREERRRRAEEQESIARLHRTQIEREEDDLRAAYRAMSLGQRVLCLPNVMKAAGFDEKGLPRLAIARSDWQWCRYDSNFNSMQFRRERGFKRNVELVMQLPTNARYQRADALVPPVPPRYRPADLSNYHTLWEAEWQPVPPEDPLLLKQIGTTVFVVVAQWDLTPIERAVLEGRFATQ